MNLLKVLGLITMVSFVALLFSGQEIADDIKDDQSHIGDTVRYENDTVVIIDYYYWTNQYELSNGKKVNIKLYNK